ncbi:hypothetical protein EAH88_11930 [Rhodanobacter glycinis]|uniref:Uncharacterized protein n=1 Tax=Rhodanobacter glycinis TaxID=582702 RepID=A0A502C695_9GAMM|nr:hypothetical protein [Rhodanobacter glycinis]TPG08333.1 hypothetical protein EAH88_11930 [Rhodanobacter glycinis]
MIALLWARVWKYVAALGVLLAAIAAIFLKGRAAGVKTMQPKVDAAKNEAAVAAATNQQLESRHETDVAVERLPDAPTGVSLGDAPPDSSAGKLSDWAD